MNHRDSGGKPIWAGAYNDGVVLLRLSHSAPVELNSIENRRGDFNREEFLMRYMRREVRAGSMAR